MPVAKPRPRTNEYMQTFTRDKFHPLDPRPEEINVEDIAHALSNICRFGGHCLEFYSVAQHSVLVSQHVKTMGGKIHEQLWGLMHDASEAYLGDMVRPLKRGMPEFRAAEEVVHNTVKTALGLTIDEHCEHLVKLADNVLLVTEARDLMGSPDWLRDFPQQPLPVYLSPWDHKYAKRRFMELFLSLQAANQLSKGCGV